MPHHALSGDSCPCGTATGGRQAPQTGQGMQDITELERRISAALERIGRGVDGIPTAQGDPPAPQPVAGDSDELASLRAQLEEERTASAQLQDRLKGLKDRELAQTAQLQEKIDRMTRQLDVQGLELQRMRRTTIGLREQLRQLREQQAAGVAEPHLINKAMLTELDALRATRLTEMAELDEIAAALDEHLTEAENA
jgi:chromosome segregation ATPase